jgi:hypothetical protein
VKQSRVVHDQVSGWLEDFVLPELGNLRREFLWQYLSVYHRWAEFHNENPGIDDQASLNRLAEFAEDALREIASQYPIRLWLNVIRSLPLPVFAHVAISEDPAYVMELVKIASAAACLHGLQNVDVYEGENINALNVTPEWLENFQRRLPIDLPRFIGAAHAWYFARGWYRIAGKGGVLIPPQPVDLKAARQAFDSLPPHAILLMPSVTFANSDEIMPLVADYDRRTAEAGASSYTGFLADANSQERKPDPLSWWHPQINIKPGEGPLVMVFYPLQNRTITTASYFPVPDELPNHLDGLAPFESLAQSRLGMEFESFALCCRALAATLRNQTGFMQLRPLTGQDKGLRFRAEHQNLETERLSSDFLFAVTQRGLLRAPRKSWLSELSRLVAEGGSKTPAQDAETFLGLFTRVRRLDPDLEPSLFLQPDPKTLVLDLISMSEFFKLCLRKMTSIDDAPTLEARRGSRFEQAVWRFLSRQLPVELAVEPNTKFKIADVEGEVDLAFLINGVVVVLECKSWQKRVDYFRGDRQAIDRRHEQLRRVVQVQLARNVSFLRNHLSSKPQCDILSFVCVVGPEFIKRGYPGLWYGSTPRVMPPQEILSLLSDASRWEETVRAGRDL